MDKKNKNPNVPNLRFAEYLDTWNNQRIDSNSLIVDGTHQTPNYITEGVKFVSVENIKNPYESNKFISKEDYNSYKIKPRIGDILMTRITAGIIGETYVINKTEDLGYYVSLALIRPDNKYINSNFLSYYINSPYFKHELDKRIIKVAFPRKINLNDIGECKISIPSLIEQEKIATLLNKIDRRIETQSKIIKDLESVKNEISNRIFKLKLIEKSTKYLAEYLREGDKTPVNTFKYKKITIKLNKQGIVYSDINRDMADTRPFYIRHKDELIIGKQNYFNGSIAIVDEQYDNCICSNAIMSFNVVGINKEFLYFQLSNNNYLNSQSYKANGTGQKELSEKELLNFKIWCPSIEEQIKIVNCFKALDGKIKNEKAVLNSYMQEKDYLLTNMFI